MKQHLLDPIQAKTQPAPASRPAWHGDAARAAPLPAPLRAAVQTLSGLPLGDVRVHYASPEPAQLRALAFTRGGDIHLARGEERHLPHEAWHVVQQAQGRVRATAQTASGVAVNDDRALEREADEMGARAARHAPAQASAAPAASGAARQAARPAVAGPEIVQGFFTATNGVKISDGDAFSVHPDGHTLFARPEAVAQANDALRGVGALVKLTSEGAPVADGRTAVAPTINAEAVTKKLGPKWSRMSSRQSADGPYRTFADCFQTSASISGIHPGNAPRLGDDPVAVMNLPTLGRVVIMDRAEGRKQGASDPGARTALSFYRAAFPHFGGVLRAAQVDDPIVARLEGAADISFAAGQILYKAIIAGAHKALFVRTYGINEALAPAIGTAFVNVGDAPEALATRERGGEMWNFHWAGIVLVDGSDYVTLENFALELEEITPADIAPNEDFLRAVFDPDGKVVDYAVKGGGKDKTDIINEKWGFKLYGTGDQSFHGVAGSNKKATKVNLSLPMRRG